MGAVMLSLGPSVEPSTVAWMRLARIRSIGVCEEHWRWPQCARATECSARRRTWASHDRPHQLGPCAPGRRRRAAGARSNAQTTWRGCSMLAGASCAVRRAVDPESRSTDFHGGLARPVAWTGGGS
eukprot:Amastigsp_a852012_12.p1 type:complete len:126 gc:universal Amastigsp_a852012_12:48-425(+)